MMLYISMKYQENILNGFQVIEPTRLRDERTVSQTDKQLRKYFEWFSSYIADMKLLQREVCPKIYRLELRFL